MHHDALIGIRQRGALRSEDRASLGTPTRLGHDDEFLALVERSVHGTCAYVSSHRPEPLASANAIACASKARPTPRRPDAMRTES